MRRLEYVLLILGVVATLASGLGYAPLARFLSGMPFTVLPLLLALGLLAVLLIRLQRLEHTASQAQGHRETLQAQFHAGVVAPGGGDHRSTAARCSPARYATGDDPKRVVVAGETVAVTAAL